MMTGIAGRYTKVSTEVAEAARSVGRDPSEICIIAVSKTVGVPEVGEAIACGIHDFGENRTDVMAPKFEAYPEERWHFIGNIQSRKIRDIVGTACLIHSVDREHIIPRLDARARELGVVQRILLEVNVSGEESKSGFAPVEVPGVIASFGSFRSLEVRGLMTMAPQADDDTVRATFRGLRMLRDRCVQTECPPNVHLVELSMGMSGDYRIAVEEGATMVRVGRVLFSEDFA